jgi:TonB family protein
MLTAAKNGDQPGLSALIKETEIPDSENWWTSTFGEEKGESWAEPYGQMLDEHEKEFQELLSQLAQQQGKLSIKKLDASKRYDTLKGKLDLYLADWEQAGTGNGVKTDHIGYFFFIDGKFRWDSTVEFMSVQRIDTPDGSASKNGASKGSHGMESSTGYGEESSTGAYISGKDGIGYPTCVYCPDPKYTGDSSKAKLQVTSLVQVIVGADGLTTNIKILKTLGPDLDEKVVRAVRTWHFKPALGPNGKPVAVVIPIEIAFQTPK